MKALTFKTILTLAGLTVSLASPLYAADSTVQFIVVDAEGNLVKAPVYINGINNSFVGGSEINGSGVVKLKAGHYQAMSARVERVMEYNQRYSSNTAYFALEDGDNQTVKLVLQPIRGADPVVTTSDLARMGLDTNEEVARNLQSDIHTR